MAEYYTKLASTCLKEQGKEVPYYLSYLEGDHKAAYQEDVKNQYTVSEFKKEMKGIYSSCVGLDTLDEAPFAYRSIAEITEQIKDTVEITEILKPVYNFKAGSRK